MAEYIEREAAKAAAFSAKPLGNTAFRDVHDTVNRLRLIPAADVAPVRHGRWTREENWETGYGAWVNVCSVCGAITPVNVSRYHYCPICGAKMDVDINVSIPDETLFRCLRVLEMWMDDNPDKRIVVDKVAYTDRYRHEIHVEGNNG